jgi:iron complex transport system substrate-binding protein
MKKFFFFVLLFVLLPLSNSHGASRWFEDEVGRNVTLSFPPKRIVSLAPNITEILFSLGVDREIVGVSIHCNYPERAKTKVRVGSYISLDFERIVSLKPDLVIATGAGNTREMVGRLEKLGLPTYVVFPKDFNGILRSIDHLGLLVHRGEEARAIVQDMERRREGVMKRVWGFPRPRVFLQVGENPLVTVGKGSFADDLIRLAGGENIAGGEGELYPRMGMEEILRRAPEVILISSMNPKGDYRRTVQEWARWNMIPAVRKRRIHVIDSDLIDRPSPRIVIGLEEIARILHLERFK